MSSELAASAATQVGCKREREKKRANSSRAATRDDPVAHAEYCQRERERNDRRRGGSGKRVPRWTSEEEVRSLCTLHVHVNPLTRVCLRRHVWEGSCKKRRPHATPCWHTVKDDH